MTDRLMAKSPLMDPSTGKRAANKAAVRQALQAAADQLFAERGYAATTVNDIAAAAGVTERTFFRYFQGKEELVLDDVLAWLPVLSERIRNRPPWESPPEAIERAIDDVARTIDASDDTNPLLLFTDGPPAGRLSRARPRLLMRMELALSGALRERLEAAEVADAEYEADLYARFGVAALRSAAIRDWQLRSRGVTDGPGMSELLRQAFSLLRPTPAQT